MILVMTLPAVSIDGQGCHVNQQNVAGSVARRVVQNGGLDGGTIGDGLVGVDTAARLLAVEVLLDQLLHAGDARGATDQDNLVDGRLSDAGVLEHLLDGPHAALEVVIAQVLEASASDRGIEVLTLEERVDLDGGAGGRGEGALGTLAGSAQAAQSAVASGQVLVRLLLELLDKEVHHALVKVFTAQVRVTGRGLDFKDTLVDGQERNIEGSTAQVKDEHVGLARALVVQAVRDGRGRGLVDDTENVQASDATSVLGGLTLLVVEVGGNGDDG